MRAHFRITIVLAFGVLAGCGADSGETKGNETKGTDAVALGKDFTLAPGQSAKLAKEGLTVTFVKVTGDSRCPQDVNCAWAGDATVTISTGGSASYDLHTEGSSARTVKISGHDVKLVGLTPRPKADSTIPPGDYRATLRIE
jgi:hypothetical protein